LASLNIGKQSLFVFSAAERDRAIRAGLAASLGGFDPEGCILDIVVAYVDEQRMLAVSYQLYRDSAAILEHWHLADPYIARVMEHCVVA